MTTGFGNKQSPARTANELGSNMRRLLAEVRILPRRMRLETPHVQATVPMLRGVWGAALHGLDREVYGRVFGPNDPSPQGRTVRRGNVHHEKGTRAPGYILRPAVPDPAFAPAVEWILLGEAIEDNFTLCRAWDVASGMGLGPERHRFRVPETLVLRADGSYGAGGGEWALDRTTLLMTQSNGLAVESVSETDAWNVPCRLVFRAPLRILYRGRLVQHPTWTDVVVAACRRVRTFLPPESRPAWDELQREAVDLSRSVRQVRFAGARLDLQRYSARQRSELELQGVSGRLDLPDGPGLLWPLLAAAQWLHVGKGTVMGLGQVEIERL